MTEETKNIIGLWHLANHAGWALPHENICWVSERHNILERDERGRLHNTSGPAVAYPDGFSIYAVHGVRVPESVVMKQADTTTDKIFKENNSEVRQVMIELYGIDRYLEDSGAEVLDSDIDLSGYPRQLLQKRFDDGEHVTFVQVKNSTKEPDGKYKDYILKVHPELRPMLGEGMLGDPQELTCHNAVASTFGMTGKEYYLTGES